jgi:hypothetical protein
MPAPVVQDGCRTWTDSGGHDDAIWHGLLYSFQGNRQANAVMHLLQERLPGPGEVSSSEVR